jgi:hypothetical protein
MGDHAFCGRSWFYHIGHGDDSYAFDSGVLDIVPIAIELIERWHAIAGLAAIGKLDHQFEDQRSISHNTIHVTMMIRLIQTIRKIRISSNDARDIFLNFAFASRPNSAPIFLDYYVAIYADTPEIARDRLYAMPVIVPV